MKGQSYTSTPPIGRTACTEPQFLYKGALYLLPAGNQIMLMMMIMMVMMTIVMTTEKYVINTAVPNIQDIKTVHKTLFRNVSNSKRNRRTTTYERMPAVTTALSVTEAMPKTQCSSLNILNLKASISKNIQWTEMLRIRQTVRKVPYSGMLHDKICKQVF
jgi:hypothetical protein